MRGHRARYSRCFLRVVVVYCLGPATVAFGQDPQLGQWTQHGPNPAYVRALAIDPSTPTTVYAGMIEDDGHAFSGVFKSLDAGITWSAANVGLPDGYGANSVKIDPLTPSTLYVALGGYYAGPGAGGVFKSTDSGSTWNALATGLPTSAGFKALAIDPSTPLTLYAGTDRAGAFKSIDGGATWSDANGGGLLSGLGILTLAIDPVTPSTLYAGTDVAGVFKSTDGGTNWRPASSGLPNFSVLSLAIDPAIPSTVFAGTDGGGVLKSLDGGSTWNDITPSQLTGFSIHAVAVDTRTTPSTLDVAGFGAGLFISPDGGNTWNDPYSTNVGLTDYLIHAIAFPLTSAAMYLGTCNQGVFVLTFS